MTEHRSEHSRGELGASRAAWDPLHGSAGFEGYDAALTAAAVHARGARGLIAVAGRDAASFLHGLLTNDILHLEPGQACYSAYLTPQGRMLSDMEVLRGEGAMLLDVEPAAREGLLRRLDQSIFTEDVTIADRSGDLSAIGVYGPAAPALLTSALRAAAGSSPPALPAADRHVTVSIDGGAAIVLRTEGGASGGFHVFAGPAQIEALTSSLLAAGAHPLAAAAAESLRIEAGIPRFGVDMTEETIPLEAGIEARAISMTKGCYIGQEVIIRILHRGQGRVAKRLVGLLVDGDAAPAAGSALGSGGRDAGSITSSVVSPRLGPIALGYVHRDFVEAGTRLSLKGAAASEVIVSRLPFEHR